VEKPKTISGSYLFSVLLDKREWPVIVMLVASWWTIAEITRALSPQRDASLAEWPLGAPFSQWKWLIRKEDGV
jgi:hypothetical protein